MNLKEAAADLGVHYQTAYKWVRSGVLPAVRIGARYEISEQGLAVFRARRRQLAATADVLEVHAGEPRLSVDDLVEELEAMSLDPLISTQAIAAHVARRCSTVFGDLCIASLLTSSGRTVTVVDHPRPDWVTYVSSAMDLAPSDPDEVLPILRVVQTGQSVRITHVPLDVLARRVRPERRQFLDRYPIRSLLAVPVDRGRRHYGYLLMARSNADHVYQPEDERAAVTVGKRVGDLVATAHEIQGAWEVRRRAVDAFEEWARNSTRALPGVVAQHLLDDVAGDSPFGVCVMDPAGRLIAVNPAFAAGAIATTGESPVGASYLELVAPEFVEEERTRFERLTSGAIDYDDFKAASRFADDRIGFFGFHRAAVRGPGADLVAVVSVARILRGRPDRTTVAPAAGRDDRPDRAVDDAGEGRIDVVAVPDAVG